MRIADPEELSAGYKREGIDPAPYYWFSDQRKYGTCKHGGYGLGVERLLAWLAHRYTVRECSLYPRYVAAHPLRTYEPSRAHIVVGGLVVRRLRVIHLLELHLVIYPGYRGSCRVTV